MSVTVAGRINATLGPTDHPYLTGPFTPNLTELDATDMEVIGRIPEDIAGAYFRNTQNQVHQPLGRFHPFDSDGMIHMMRFEGGRATYRNRAVRTTGFLAEAAAGKSLWAGLMEAPAKSRPGWGAHGFIKDAPSTDVVVHAGRALTTYYQCGEAYRLDAATLDTLGPETWGGMAPDEGVSAHCKVDLATGELLFFNYSRSSPYMHYGVVGADNNLKHYVPVPLPGPRLPHDMAFTKNYSILNDFPLFWDPEMLARGMRVVRYFPHLGSRFAVIPRYGKTEDIRWFDAAPTFVLHFLNAWEEGDEIIMDGYFQKSPMPVSPPDAPDIYKRMMVYLDMYAMQPHLHRWRFNMKTGATREEKLDDRVLEFGMFNQDYAGRPYRYAFSAQSRPGWFLFTGLVKHDLATGQSQTLEFGDQVYGSESPFAPRIGAKDEDDGYLVSFLTDMKNDRSECWLVDAKRFADGPVCRVILPQRIASGTHSTWAQAREFA